MAKGKLPIGLEGVPHQLGPIAAPELARGGTLIY
jgi:hypothetical protein